MIDGVALAWWTLACMGPVVLVVLTVVAVRDRLTRRRGR